MRGMEFREFHNVKKKKSKFLYILMPTRSSVKADLCNTTENSCITIRCPAFFVYAFGAFQRTPTTAPSTVQKRQISSLVNPPRLKSSFASHHHLKSQHNPIPFPSMAKAPTVTNVIRHIHLPSTTPFALAERLQSHLVHQQLSYKALISSPTPPNHLPPAPTPTILTFEPTPVYTTGRRELGTLVRNSFPLYLLIFLSFPHNAHPLPTEPTANIRPQKAAQNPIPVAPNSRSNPDPPRRPNHIPRPGPACDLSNL